MGALLARKPANQSEQSLLQVPQTEGIKQMQISIQGSQDRDLDRNYPQLKISRKKVRTQQKLQKQMQLDSNDKMIQQKWYRKVYFTPESKFILIFKSINLLLIYIYFLEIPITIAFQKHRDEDQSQRFFQIINIPAIVIFLVAIAIKLKTGFYKEGILIFQQHRIIKNYLLYNLVFDFLSITSIIVYEFSEIKRDKGTDPISYRYIVLLFYLKIPQIFSIQSSIISSFDLNRRTKALLKLVLLLTKIFMLCNIAACCFFFISDNICPMDDCEDCCWIYQLQILNGNLKQNQWYIQYAFSLYWASTTMLTIGYGDITPQNLPQAVYTVCAQFISCVLFAFSVNEIWSIIQEKNTKRFKIHSRLNIMNVYMRDKNVSAELKSRVNAYLSHFYHTKNLRQKQLENEIMSELTPSLRKQLYFEQYGFLFHTHSFFKNFSDQFLEHVSQHIRQVGFFQEELVYSPNIKQNLSLYYVHKGQLESFVELGNSRTKNVMLNELEKGQIIGLYEFVRQVNYCSSLMALKYSLLYVLDYSSWVQCAKQQERDYQIFCVIKHNALYQRKVKKLDLRCKLCGAKKHQSDQCIEGQINEINSSFLNKYLRKAERTPYIRKNFKTGIIDLKSQPIILEPTSPRRFQRQRKNSAVLRRDSLKNQSNKKSIFHKKTHKQRMSKIIQKQINESIWSEQSQSDDEIVSQVVDIDFVQNYQNYWPIMNATNNDWGKERRRLTFNRLFQRS